LVPRVRKKNEEPPLGGREKKEIRPFFRSVKWIEKDKRKVPSVSEPKGKSSQRKKSKNLFREANEHRQKNQQTKFLNGGGQRKKKKIGGVFGGGRHFKGGRRNKNRTNPFAKGEKMNKKKSKTQQSDRTKGWFFRIRWKEKKEQIRKGREKRRFGENKQVKGLALRRDLLGPKKDAPVIC